MSDDFLDADMSVDALTEALAVNCEIERLKAENERLTLLNEDKFKHLQGYCKAGDPALWDAAIELRDALAQGRDAT